MASVTAIAVFRQGDDAKDKQDSTPAGSINYVYSATFNLKLGITALFFFDAGSEQGITGCLINSSQFPASYCRLPANSGNMALMPTKILDPELNFEKLWETFQNRYPFFVLRDVDWKQQYDSYRPKVTPLTTDDELFNIFCAMLDPLDDGHVELKGRTGPDRRKRVFNPEPKPRFWREFSRREIKRLFETTQKTLSSMEFGPLEKTSAWMLHYCRSPNVGYIRILELEGVKKRKLTAALDRICHDFNSLEGLIIDIRDNPGGDDSTVISIVNRFCNREQIAFHRKTKSGPGVADFAPLKSWHIRPQGPAQFTGPIVLITCDSVFSGGEVFALAMRQLPHVTIIGDETNGIFSYQLEKQLPNGWRYRLSYQMYFSADMVCYEGRGVPVDIKLLNTKSDIDNGVDPLISRALDIIGSQGRSVSAIE